jgi:hypothetical protein
MTEMGDGGKGGSLASESVSGAAGGVAVRHGIGEGGGVGTLSVQAQTSTCPAQGDEGRGGARGASYKSDSQLCMFEGCVSIVR